jgi:hypothetical protein
VSKNRTTGNDENGNGEKRKRWRIETIISVFALLVSCGTLAFTFTYNLFPGRVQPFSPSGYVIIRGVDPFPSDHLVLPIEWENGGGRSVLIRHPRLILRELDSDGNEVGVEYTFFLAGEYPDISSTSFREGYSIKRSFILEPHSVALKMLVFHIEDWWDEQGDLYNFRFTGDQNFQVYIEFQRNLEALSVTALFDMSVYPSADGLDHSTTYWWDFWSVDR